MKTRIPATPALGMVTGHVGDVLDRRAEAGRADERAVRAREAALGHVVPALMLVARIQKLLDPRRVDAIFVSQTIRNDVINR